MQDPEAVIIMCIQHLATAHGLGKQLVRPGNALPIAPRSSPTAAAGDPVPFSFLLLRLVSMNFRTSQPETSLCNPPNCMHHRMSLHHAEVHAPWRTLHWGSTLTTIIMESPQVRRRWKREIWSAEGSLYLYSALLSHASALQGDESVEVERVDVAHNSHRLIDAACILQLEGAFAPQRTFQQPIHR
jgi:hypothetical protein